MKCPKCTHQDSKVVESRDTGEGDATRRRRQCLTCGHRFTTYERLEMPYLAVKKKDGVNELFDRNKLLGGLRKACEKRPVTTVQLEEIVSEIERSAYDRGESEITSSELGELVMGHLMSLDDVAYVRFASVYRSFADVASFEKELARLKKRRNVDSRQSGRVVSKSQDTRVETHHG